MRKSSKKMNWSYSQIYNINNIILNMVININSSLYRFSCRDCEWSEDILVKNFPYSILEDKIKIPKKCPKCESKLNKQKITVQF